MALTTAAVARQKSAAGNAVALQEVSNAIDTAASLGNYFAVKTIEITANCTSQAKKTAEKYMQTLIQLGYLVSYTLHDAPQDKVHLTFTVKW